MTAETDGKATDGVTGPDYLLAEGGTWRRCAARFTGPGGGQPNAEAHFQKHAVLQREWHDEIPDVASYIGHASEHLNLTDAYELYDLTSRSIVKYSLNDNELGIATAAEGHIRTFFRPRTGPAYVEQRLKRGDWIPHDALTRDLCWSASELDDVLAAAMRAMAEEILSRLDVLQYDAIESARSWLETRTADHAHIEAFAEFLAALGMLESMVQAAKRVAATQDQEAIARDLEEKLAEWEGVWDAVAEAFGSQAPSVVAAAAEEDLTVLAIIASRRRGLSFQRESATEDAEDLWYLRDRLEMLLAHLALFATNSDTLLDDYLRLRLRTRIVDRDLRRLHEQSPPAARSWEPLHWAWWRSGG